MRTKTILLVAITAACAVAGAAYVAVAALNADGTTSDARPRVTADAATFVPQGARLLVRAVDTSNPRLNGRLFDVAFDDDGASEEVGDVACERAHFNARGDGICLAADDHGFGYHGLVLGPGYARRARFSVPGSPDRARMSPDGRFAAYTTFLSGHTYSASGVREFSVRTAIVDARTGDPLFSLDELDITDLDGEPFDRDDVNLWGVTFAGGDRFYATLGVEGRHYLLEGSVSRRSARMIRAGVECPSLSPGGSRIAYKRRIGNQDRWRLHVLDLATGEDTPLAERRSIDDQPEWLDERRIVYSDDRAVFVVPADGSGEPRRIIARASSPAALP